MFYARHFVKLFVVFKGATTNLLLFMKCYERHMRVFFLITFCVSRRRRKMYCGHARLCVCLSVCLSATVRAHYYTDSDVTWGMVEAAP